MPILREPELISEIPVPSSQPRTFGKYNQSCIARQCTVTRRRGELREKTATLLTIEYQVQRSRRSKCRMHDDKTTSQNLSRCSKKHRYKEQFIQDMNQKQEIKKFSEESSNFVRILQNFNVLIANENLKCKRSPTTTQKAICDYSSIPRLVIKKNSSRGTKHGQSERQIMFCRAKQMLKKARQEKHGIHLFLFFRDRLLRTSTITNKAPSTKK